MKKEKKKTLIRNDKINGTKRFSILYTLPIRYQIYLFVFVFAFARSRQTGGINGRRRRHRGKETKKQTAKKKRKKIDTRFESNERTMIFSTHTHTNTRAHRICKRLNNVDICVKATEENRD